MQPAQPRSCTHPMQLLSWAFFPPQPVPCPPLGLICPHYCSCQVLHWGHSPLSHVPSSFHISLSLLPLSGVGGNPAGLPGLHTGGCCSRMRGTAEPYDYGTSGMGQPGRGQAKGRMQESWLAWPSVLCHRDGLSWLAAALRKLEEDNRSPRGCFVSSKGTD